MSAGEIYAKWYFWSVVILTALCAPDISLRSLNLLEGFGTLGAFIQALFIGVIPAGIGGTIHVIIAKIKG